MIEEIVQKLIDTTVTVRSPSSVCLPDHGQPLHLSLANMFSNVSLSLSWSSISSPSLYSVERKLKHSCLIFLKYKALFRHFLYIFFSLCDSFFFFFSILRRWCLSLIQMQSTLLYLEHLAPLPKSCFRSLQFVNILENSPSLCLSLSPITKSSLCLSFKLVRTVVNSHCHLTPVIHWIPASAHESTKVISH